MACKKEDTCQRYNGQESKENICSYTFCVDGMEALNAKSENGEELSVHLGVRNMMIHELTIILTCSTRHSHIHEHDTWNRTRFKFQKESNI